jgi:hypothetical protein
MMFHLSASLLRFLTLLFLWSVTVYIHNAKQVRWQRRAPRSVCKSRVAKRVFFFPHTFSVNYLCALMMDLPRTFSARELARAVWCQVPIPERLGPIRVV